MFIGWTARTRWLKQTMRAPLEDSCCFHKLIFFSVSRPFYGFHGLQLAMTTPSIVALRRAVDDPRSFCFENLHFVSKSLLFSFHPSQKKLNSSRRFQSFHYISLLDKMENKNIISRPVFRNRYQCEDEEEIMSVGSRDNSSVIFSLLNTFSCESDMELFDSFNSRSYFAIGDNERYETRSQDEQKTDPMQQQEYSLKPTVVTPNKVCPTTVEVSVDSIPESQLQPLPLHGQSDDINDHSAADFGLLFPSADQESPNTTHLECKTSFMFENNVDVNATPKNSSLVTCNLDETYVYKRLRPSLPVPESFGPILCLLLHMELSSTIDGTVMKRACGVFNEGWKDGLSGLSRSNERQMQTVSGKIVDKLVETLGPMVDLSAMFQASAKTYSDLSRAEDDRLSVFFENENDMAETDETKSQAIEHVATKSCDSIVPNHSELVAGPSYQLRSKSNCEYNQTAFKNGTDFAPTMLQLAIAYGASYTRIGSESGKMSLQEFVKQTSNHLQCMNPDEKRNAWNGMLGAWREEEEEKNDKRKSNRGDEIEDAPKKKRRRVTDDGGKEKETKW